MRISHAYKDGSDRKLAMKRCLSAKGAIACASLLLTLVAKAGAVQLVTQEEAAYPDDPYAADSPRGSPTAGPQIEVVSPALSGLISSPFQFKVKFKAHAGATIDADSIAITYKKIPAIDITQRIKAYIVDGEINIADAQLPAGTHPFRIDVKDTRGRWAVPAYFKIGITK
jgi:hypothetical protein